jgi:A/G-specific adenine glycosylase
MKARNQKSKSPAPHADIAARLVAWFQKNQRAMPWRKTRDPYCIWLSEVMLQQTQVATVIPYYERFVKKFPTVTALANAPLDEVLKLWSGLGYYSRARNLHRGAQVIAERFGGQMPMTPELIREVPGIGPYTAGAVLSIAYGVKQPLVDGNVARVLARLFLLTGDYRKSSGKEQVWRTATDLIESCGASLYPGDLNQSLMELGATICTPRNPVCARCPLAEHCRAHKTGEQHNYPQLEQKAAVSTWTLRAGVVEDAKGRLLFAKRESEGLFGGLWEVPTERVEVTHKKEKGEKPLARLTHVLTHRILEIDAVRPERSRAEAMKEAEQFPCWSGKYTHFCWLDSKRALSGKEIALSSVQKKLLRALGAKKE